MDIVNPKKIEDIIISILIKGKRKSTPLLEEVRLLRRNTTKQGFYAILRKLRRNEVVLVYKGIVSLNVVWIKKIKNIFELADKKYLSDQESFDALKLENGESMNYIFKNLNNLDIFWGHSQNIFINNSPITEPIYCYDPHYWLYLARNKSEKDLLNEIIKNKRQFLMNVGNTTFLDKFIKKDFHSKYVQYNYKKIFNKNNYYITVIGEYITEVYFDKKISNEIDDFYNKTTILNNKTIESLKGFLNKRIKSRIKMTRNKSKANKLKNKLGKDFY